MAKSNITSPLPGRNPYKMDGGKLVEKLEKKP